MRPLAAVLRGLADAGHTLFMAARNVNTARGALHGLPVRLLPAPVLMDTRPGRAVAGSYPQLLEQAGYADRDTLATLADGWRALNALVEPDVILAEHSPTALLAARMDGIPSVAAGSGFMVPPLSAPMATIAPGMPVSPRELARSERSVLERLNQVLAGAGAAPLESCAELLAATRRVLWTLPELDHYGEREGDEYAGPVIATTDGPVPWPDAGGARIFGYFHVRLPGYALLLEAMQSTGLPGVLVAGGATDEDLAAASPTVTVTARQVDLRRVAREAALVITHCAYASLAACLLGGAPQLALPQQMEQRMLAFRLRERGLVEALPGNADAGQIADGIRRVLAPARPGDAILAFARRYRDFDRDSPVARAVAACEEVL